MFNGFIDFGYLKFRLIPYFLRRPTLFAVFKSICAPLTYLNDSLVTFIEDIEYCLTITGQKIYLEKMLNDKFDEYLRRIRVINNNPDKFVFLYNLSENRPPLFVTNIGEILPFKYDVLTNSLVQSEVYLRDESEIVTLYDYTVQYPASMGLNQNSLRDKINKYNPSGRIYNFDLV